MDTNLTIDYDSVGDILYVKACPNYREQESTELGDSIVGRLNPRTGDVEALEILFFMARVNAGQRVRVPVKAQMLLLQALDVFE
ncbi:MAG TPA: DUF2283 domain-containing protein [Dehalococcoidia bacterium]